MSDGITDSSREWEVNKSVPDDVSRQDIKRKQEDEWLLEKLKINHSDATKRMFSEFVLMYREIELLGINHKRLSRVWNPARTG